MDIQTLSVRKGDDLQFRVPVVDQDGVAVNITAASMRFSVKKSWADADAAALITRTVGSGITLTTPASGIADVTATAAQTATLSAPALYYWDVQLTLSGVVSTVAYGVLETDVDISTTTP